MFETYVNNPSGAQGNGASDSDLFSRAQGGEMSAFEELVARYRDGVYGLGLRLTKSETRAAEITNESFLSAYLQLKDFRNEAQFAARVLLNAANSALTKPEPAGAAQTGEEGIGLPQFNERGSFAEYPEMDWSRRAEAGALSGELRRAIQQATDRLPPAHRQVLLLKDLVGLGYEDIAGICGDSVPAIKNRVHQARLCLREEIDRFYTNS